MGSCFISFASFYKERARKHQVLSFFFFKVTQKERKTQVFIWLDGACLFSSPS